MDVSAIISQFGASYTVTTRTEGGYDADGRVQAAATSAAPVDMAVFPAPGDVLQRLPEGRRAEAAVLVFSAARLYAGGDRSTKATSTFAHDGRTWEVGAVKEWLPSGVAKATFWEAVATMVEA